MHINELEDSLTRQSQILGPLLSNRLTPLLVKRLRIIASDLTQKPKKIKEKGRFILDMMRRIPYLVNHNPRIIVSLIDDFQIFPSHMSFNVIPQTDDVPLFVGVDSKVAYFYVPSIPCANAAAWDLLQYGYPFTFHDHGKEMERMDNWNIKTQDPKALFMYDRHDPVGYVGLGLRGFFVNDPYHFQFPYH